MSDRQRHLLEEMLAMADEHCERTRHTAHDGALALQLVRHLLKVLLAEEQP